MTFEYFSALCNHLGSHSAQILLDFCHYRSGLAKSLKATLTDSNSMGPCMNVDSALTDRHQVGCPTSRGNGSNGLVRKGRKKEEKERKQTEQLFRGQFTMSQEIPET